MKKISLFLLPLALFLFTAVFLFQGLYSDPRERQSMVLDQPVPEFALPDLMNSEVTYTPSVFDGQVTLLNVWGVWCVTCAVELPYLTQLREQGVRIVGLYYDQDLDPDFGEKSLQQVQQEVEETVGKLGNPYQFNIYDVYRDLSLDLGVTGAPEMFLIDQNGVVRMHHIGDVNTRVWRGKFAPVYQQLVSQTQVGMP